MEAETIESHQTSKTQKQHTGTDHHGSIITPLDVLEDVLTGVGSAFGLHNNAKIMVKAFILLFFIIKVIFFLRVDLQRDWLDFLLFFFLKYCNTSISLIDTFFLGILHNQGNYTIKIDPMDKNKFSCSNYSLTSTSVFLHVDVDSSQINVQPPTSLHPSLVPPPWSTIFCWVGSPDPVSRPQKMVSFITEECTPRVTLPPAMTTRPGPGYIPPGAATCAPTGGTSPGHAPSSASTILWK